MGWKLARIPFGILIFLALFIHATFTFAQKESAQELKTDLWMIYYYLNPQPDKTPQVILEMSQEGVFNMENALPPVIAFYSRIFAQNPNKLRTWFTELERLPKEHKKVLWLALWYADTPEATEQLRLIAEKTAPSDKGQLTELLQSHAPTLTSIEINEPGVLDMLWGAFMATGDDRYVIRIMSALPWVNQKRDLTKALLGGVARWSMTSNCIQHEKVLQICKEQVTKQPQEVSQVLTGIIKEAETEIRKSKNSK